jgi:hypothetical protein
MKHRLIYLVGLALASLLLAASALTQPTIFSTLASGLNQDGLGGSGATLAAGKYVLSGQIDQLEATTLRGGHYQLTSVTPSDSQTNSWQASDLASGGGYHLKVLASPQLTGNGCCCVYLPCVKK